MRMSKFKLSIQWFTLTNSLSPFIFNASVSLGNENDFFLNVLSKTSTESCKKKISSTPLLPASTKHSSLQIWGQTSMVHNAACVCKNGSYNFTIFLLWKIPPLFLNLKTVFPDHVALLSLNTQVLKEISFVFCFHHELCFFFASELFFLLNPHSADCFDH